jgi:hypothetical protein
MDFRGSYRGSTVLFRLAFLLPLLMASQTAVAQPSGDFCNFVSTLRSKPCLAKVQCVDQGRNEILKEMVCSCLRGDVAAVGGQSFAPEDNRLQVACCFAGAMVRNPALCDR